MTQKLEFFSSRKQLVESHETRMGLFANNNIIKSNQILKYPFFTTQKSSRSIIIAIISFNSFIRFRYYISLLINIIFIMRNDMLWNCWNYTTIYRVIINIQNIVSTDIILLLSKTFRLSYNNIYNNVINLRQKMS